MTLKRHVEDLVSNGYLNYFVETLKRQRGPGYQDQRSHTMIIAGGPTLARDSNKVKKKYSRMLVRPSYLTQVFSV